MPNRKLFALPPNKQIKPANNTGSASRNPSFKANLNKLDTAINQMKPGYKEQLASNLANYASNYVGGKIDQYSPMNNSGGKKTPPQKGGSMVVFKGSKSISENNMTYALSKAPNPKDISLNSGIKPNTYVNDFMTPVEGSCSPMHMSLGILGIPTAGSNPISTYFANTICFDIQTRAQSNVGFSLDVGTQFTSVQITAAFNAAIQALQTYYFYTSIMSYESDTRNKNAGMKALRDCIDSQTLNDLTRLGRRLEDTPVPPRVVEWVRYMSGNFLSSDSQGAPIIKIYNDFLQTSLVTPALPTLPAQALTALDTAANNIVYTLLRRSIPKWRIGTLYDVPSLPTFDKNFLTIFANLSSSSRVSAVNTFTGSVTDLVTNVPYNAYANTLDGLAYAMTNVYIPAQSLWYPGLCRSYSSSGTNLDTKRSYYTVSNVSAFYDVVTYPFLALSRQETNVIVGTTTYTPHLFGTEKCQGVDGYALVQSAQNALDFMFDVDSIPTVGLLSHFNNKANGKI